MQGQLALVEGVGCTIEQVVGAGLVLRLELDQPLPGFVAAFGGVPLNLALVLAPWRLAELASEDLAIPVVGLPIHLHCVAHNLIVAVGVQLGELFGVFHELVQRRGRLLRVQAGGGKEILVPEEGQGADGGGDGPVLALELASLHQRRELAFDH